MATPVLPNSDTDSHTDSDAPVRILGLGGSTRAGSITERLLTAVLGLADEAGAQTTLLSVRDLDLPMFNDDIPFGEQPDVVHTLLAEVRAADAFVLASPTYHGTISGAFKNVLDFLNVDNRVPRTYFDGRPIGLAAFGGPSALNVINALGHSVRGLRGMQVPTVLTAGRNAIDGETATFADDATRARAEKMVGELILLARLLRDSQVRTGV